MKANHMSLKYCLPRVMPKELMFHYVFGEILRCVCHGEGKVPMDAKVLNEIVVSGCGQTEFRIKPWKIIEKQTSGGIPWWNLMYFLVRSSGWAACQGFDAEAGCLVPGLHRNAGCLLSGDLEGGDLGDMKFLSVCFCCAFGTF